MSVETKQEPTAAEPPREPRLWESLLLGTTVDRAPAFIPGVLLAAAIVVASIFLSDWINESWGYKGLISYILIAIVVGIVVRNTIGLHQVFVPGIGFCLKKLLRLGIILMGIRLSIVDVAEIGGYGLPIVIGCVFTGLFVTTYVTRFLKLPDRLGTLIAIGTGICGASAIVATAPGIRAKDEEVAYAIANITVFGIAAMFLYPYLADLIFSGDLTMSGLFMGTSIHETAQVAGAGLIYDQTFDITTSPSGADVAIVVKLVRNLMMVVAIPGITYIYSRRLRAQGQDLGGKTSFLQLIPVFIIGFVIMAVLRSIGDANLEAGRQAYGLWAESTWDSITSEIRTWSGYILATAMAGVGLGTSLKVLKGLGLRPFLVGILAATSVGLVSVLLVFALGSQVTL
jgi:uncharacterized integral membrane protein (TIGR00698 family)